MIHSQVDLLRPIISQTIRFTSKLVGDILNPLGLRYLAKIRSPLSSNLTIKADHDKMWLNENTITMVGISYEIIQIEPNLLSLGDSFKRSESSGVIGLLPMLPYLGLKLDECLNICNLLKHVESFSFM